MSTVPQRRTPAGGPGLETEQQINFGRSLYGAGEVAARAGYRGMVPRPAAPTPRDPLAIAHDLRAAADHLADLADDLAAGAFDARALSSADALLVGCGRLVCELRAREAA